MRDALSQLADAAEDVLTEITDEDTGWYYQLQAAMQNARRVLRQTDPADVLYESDVAVEERKKRDLERRVIQTAVGRFYDELTDGLVPRNFAADALPEGLTTITDEQLDAVTQATRRVLDQNKPKETP